MADPLRNESGTPEHSTASLPTDPVLDDRGVDELLSGFPADRTLPASENPRLNRTAETIGAALGTTVGKMRSGLTLVQDRQREATRNLSDTLSQQAENLTATVREQAGRVGDVVQDKTEQFVQTSQERWVELRKLSGQKLMEARNRAAVLRQDRPLQLIGAFAATAFVVGVALRVWRASDDR